MPLAERLPLEQLALGLVIHDPMLIILQFWPDDVTDGQGVQNISIEQRLFLCDVSERVLLCTGRKIAKTMRLERDVIQGGLTYPRRAVPDEGLFCTPAQAHMNPVRDRIFAKIVAQPIFLEMIAKNPGGGIAMSKGDGVCQFKTGFKWHFRIEGTSGTDLNMVGLRSKKIICDEMAFGNEVCHKSRINTAMPGCTWVYAGVPNGVRGTPFWRLDQTQEGSHWSRHKYPQFINPLYASASAQETLIRDHGGEHTHSYITQVLGEWGDSVMSSFPPGTISTYNDRPYFVHDWGETMGKHAVERGKQIDYDYEHLGDTVNKRCVIGWDYGVSPDPAVLSLFFEDEPGRWYLRVMFVLRQVTSPHQIDLVNQLATYFHIVFIISDESVIVQQLESYERWALYDEVLNTGNIQWANLNGRIELVDSSGHQVLDETGTPIREYRKKWATDEFRNAMVHAVEHLPHSYLIYIPEKDDYLIQELIGTTERRTVGGYTQYLTAKTTEGSKSPDDHRTDSCRFAVLALYSLLGMKKASSLPPFEEYQRVMGWLGRPREGWTPPWEHN